MEHACDQNAALCTITCDVLFFKKRERIDGGETAALWLGKFLNIRPCLLVIYCKSSRVQAAPLPQTLKLLWPFLGIQRM